MSSDLVHRMMISVRDCYLIIGTFEHYRATQRALINLPEYVQLCAKYVHCLYNGVNVAVSVMTVPTGKYS